MKIKLLMGCLAILLLAIPLTACSKTTESIDLSDNLGFIYCEPELSYIPPMPDGYIDRDTIKDALEETLIIEDLSIFDSFKPYYRPFTVEAYEYVKAKNQSRYNAYHYPFYACDDYTESCWGDFNDLPQYANMPVFFAHIERPNGNPHAVLIVYYNDDIWYIECTRWFGAGVAPHNMYTLINIIG